MKKNDSPHFWRKNKGIFGKYKVITLCGSTRFKEAFLEAQKRLTLAGNMVLNVDVFDLPKTIKSEQEAKNVKAMLKDMHRRKIDMADEISF